MQILFHVLSILYFIAYADTKSLHRYKTDLGSLF